MIGFVMFLKSDFIKCIISEEEWDCLKCKSCGGVLSEGVCDSKGNEVKECSDCGECFLLLRRV